jgi:protein phosphatase
VSHVTAPANLARLSRSAPAGFQVHGLSHPGVVREENEDTWYTDARIGLAIAADGVGGHGDGAWASQAATQWISRFIRRVYDRRPNAAFDDPAVQERVIRHAIKFAHHRMLSGRDGKERMRRGSTIVGLWAPGGADAAATVFHVGDSRLYLLRQGKLLQLTRDHSAYEQWRAGGEVGTAPSKKYILQAMGLSDRVEPTIQTIVPVTMDKVLICTDGLTGSVEDKDLSTILSSDAELSTLCDRLIASGLAHAAQDNLTAVLCTFRTASSKLP